MRSRTFGLTIAGVVGSVAALSWVLAIWTSSRVTTREVPAVQCPDSVRLLPPCFARWGRASGGELQVEQRRVRRLAANDNQWLVRY